MIKRTSSWFIFSTLLFVICFSCSIFITAAVAKENDYDKKLFKHLKKFDVKDLPDNEQYPGADAIIIFDRIQKRQFFGFHSMWDITQEIHRYKVWKVLKPEVERLKSIVIELGDSRKLDEVELMIYPPAGEAVKVKEKEFTKDAAAATYQFSGLAADTIVELTYVVKEDAPLHWENYYIQGPDPIVRLHYGFTTPEFVKLAPTHYYTPVAHANPFSYRFRVFDSVQKKLLKPQTDSEGFYFDFSDQPAWLPAPYALPKANRSSLITFCVNELIVKNTLEMNYDEEKHQQYMQIPASDLIQSGNLSARQGELKKAGSPAAYKYDFSQWDNVADYLYFDVLKAIAKSEVFSAKSKEITENATISAIATKRIYEYCANNFTVEKSETNDYSPTLKTLEAALKDGKASQRDMGFLLWGLFHHAGIETSVALGFDHSVLVGEVDKKLPMPLNFDMGLVLQKDKNKLYFPGDPAVAMGHYPPELEGTSLLCFTLEANSDEEIQTTTDPKSPYITQKTQTRVKTEWFNLSPGSPLDNKTVNKLELTVAEDGSITTTLATSFVGHNETLLRRKIISLSEEDAKKELEKWVSMRTPDTSVKITKMKNWNKSSGSLEFEAELTLPIKVENDTLTIPFSLFNESEVIPLDELKDRQRDVFFPFRYFNFDDFMITYEKGWQLKTAPENVQNKSNVGMIGVNIRQNEISFNYQRGFSMFQYFTPMESISQLLDFYKQIKEVETSDILVLEKK